MEKCGKSSFVEHRSYLLRIMSLNVSDSINVFSGWIDCHLVVGIDFAGSVNSCHVSALPSLIQFIFIYMKYQIIPLFRALYFYSLLCLFSEINRLWTGTIRGKANELEWRSQSGCCKDTIKRFILMFRWCLLHSHCKKNK